MHIFSLLVDIKECIFLEIFWLLMSVEVFDQIKKPVVIIVHWTRLRRRVGPSAVPYPVREVDYQPCNDLDYLHLSILTLMSAEWGVFTWTRSPSSDVTCLAPSRPGTWPRSQCPGSPSGTRWGGSRCRGRRGHLAPDKSLVEIFKSS